MGQERSAPLPVRPRGGPEARVCRASVQGTSGACACDGLGSAVRGWRTGGQGQTTRCRPAEADGSRVCTSC